MKNKQLFRNVLAIIVILIGVFLVLANVGVVSWKMHEAWLYIYPSFFVLLGLKWIWDAITGKWGLWAGLFFVIFGGLLLMDRFDLLQFTFWNVYKLWPLLIVYVGFSIFSTSTKRKNGKPKFQFVYDSDGAKAYPKKQKFAIGDHKYNSPNWKVEPMDLWNAVGDYHIDFTKAFIPDKEIPIKIQGWAGDIRILMPENVDFKVEAHVKAGDINVFGERVDGINRDLFYETPHYDTATRRLNIYLGLKAGDIRVDKV